MLDRNFGNQNGMSNDDRRARQMIEDQLRVISSVCKKLNQDIEVNNLRKFLNAKTIQSHFLFKNQLVLIVGALNERSQNVY